MIKFFVLLCSIVLCSLSFAQLSRIDSISAIIEKTGNTDQKAGLLISRSRAWGNTNTENALTDVQQSLAFYQQTNNEQGQIDAYLQLSSLYSRQNKYKLALDIDSIAFKMASKIIYKKGHALALSNMGRNLQQVGDMQQAKRALLESRNMMLEAGMEPETTEILNRLGIIYRKFSAFKTSLKYFDEALVLAKQYNQTMSIANIYMNKANTLNETAQYDEAIKMHLESIRLKEKAKDKRGLAQSYNNLASVYANANQNEASLQYYRLTKDLNEAPGVNNKTSTALAYSNLASALGRLHQYDSVEYYYTKALALFGETGEKPGLALVYNELGTYFTDIKKYEMALAYFKKALALRVGTNLIYDEASTRNSIGVVLGKMNRKKEAAVYLLQSLSLVRNDGSKLQQDIYLSLANHYKEVGNFEKATEFQSKYISIKDTLITETEAVNMVKAQSNYEIEKRETQIELSKKEQQVNVLALANRNKTIWILSIGFIFLLCFIGFLINNVIQKRKAAAFLAAKNNRIETLVRELHHRVKNNLQIVSGLLSLQANRLEDAHAKEAMDEGRNRVDAMAMIHQKLYMNDDFVRVDIEDYLQNLSTSLAKSFGFTEEQIKTTIDLETKTLDIDQAIPIGLIVNELVTNAFKYAFTTTVHPQINIQLLKQPNNSIALSIADNGNGNIATTASNSNSFGMKLVQTLVAQLNGTLQLQHHNGTIYNILISA